MALDLTPLLEALRKNQKVVLSAPPGTGKTTTIPPVLLAEEWLGDKKIIVLEPRRLAARRAAIYIAGQRGERVGKTIGWRVRNDVCVSSETRIEFMTEALLTRKILEDPELSDVGCVIFDEFHERALSLDTSFALLNEVRDSLRSDLRMVIMSATVQENLIPDAIFLHLPAKAYPVEIRWCGTLSPETVIRKALNENEGSLLVFLPGEKEIRTLEKRLYEKGLPHDTFVAPLYAALNHAEQDKAVAPPPFSKRKIVLATSIAESSLTIEGVTVVIDTGLARVPQFSPRNGLTRLVTTRIPLDRITQRTGRAGRTAPGVCYRLWTQQEEYTFTKTSQPEILNADLTQTALFCGEWGAETLNWLTPPPPSSWQYARQTLCDLGALDEKHHITAFGHRLVHFPTHPALAAMMTRLESIDRCGGALLAAICSEGERFTFLRDLHDFRTVVETVLRERPREIWELATRWAGRSPLPRLPMDELLPYLLWAFPGHLARQRTPSSLRYLLASGFGATLPDTTTLRNAPWLFAVNMTDGDGDAVIRWAFPLEERHLTLLSPKTRTRVEWDNVKKKIIAAEECCYGEIILKSTPLNEIPPDLRVEAERCRLKAEGLPWTQVATHLMERLTFLNKHLPDENYPLPTEAQLIDALALHPKRPLLDILVSLLAESGHTLYEMDIAAPTHFCVPSGSRIPIHYEATLPYIQVKIQEVFGLKETPRLAKGLIPLSFHLLSPAQRPVQITSDLASFWTTSYAIIRKELRGRYPKHHWPEDPTVAIPSKNTLKPRPPLS